MTEKADSWGGWVAESATVGRVLSGGRVRLVPATRAMVEAELEGAERLASVLDVAVPPDWPPEHHDADVLRFTRDALERPGAPGWWLHYVVAADADRPTLAGTAGFKGPPRHGVVEIGYSIVPSQRRRGLATEACRALIAAAYERGAETIVAHTLPELEPSIGVLRKLGFTPAEPPEPGVLEFRLSLAAPPGTTSPWPRTTGRR